MRSSHSLRICSPRSSSSRSRPRSRISRIRSIHSPMPLRICSRRSSLRPRELLSARSRSSRAFFMRSSIAFLQSAPEERCGVRDRDQPLDWGARRESLSAFSLASRAFFMRSSQALRICSLRSSSRPRELFSARSRSSRSFFMRSSQAFRRSLEELFCREL